MKSIFSVIAGLLFIGAFIPYILAILRDKHLPPGAEGKTEPSKVTWIIWASLDSIVLVGMYFKETINGQIIGAVLGAWIVVIFAVRYGESKWSKLDKWCLGGAVLGIFLWKIFKEATFGIMISLGVIFIGFIPTLKSAWKDPGREDKLAWTIFWTSCVYAVLAIPKWTLADAAQPITFFVIETIMMYILYIRHR